MTIGIYQTPTPSNEPIKSYAPQTPERAELKKELKRQTSARVTIPVIVGGKEIKTGKTQPIIAPHNKSLKLGVYHQAGKKEILAAIKAAKEAYTTWSSMPWEDRAAIFLKAADLISVKYRHILNASTMLGQSKSVFQAEIDSTCELADFFRFNAHYMTQIYRDQPLINPHGIWNRLEYRPLEGFVFAVTPFNFTSIAGNLPTAPAIMGNVVIWKPSSASMLSSWYIMKLLKDAGLPDGVINMVPGRGKDIADTVLNHKDLAGIHFTGSTRVFTSMWKTVGENLSKGLYKNYPRIVGETGGKDFIFAHPDCDVKGLAVAVTRGSFEYQGQKCSAVSRIYVPSSIWKNVLKEIKSMTSKIKMGDVADFKTFMGAVINKEAFDKITGYIEYARKSKKANIVIGGDYNDSKGYFIEPTVITTTDPHFKLLEEEIFGPVVTVYVYDDKKINETLSLLDSTSPYALTGAVFAKDRSVIRMITDRLRNAAGNFYVNDKPTGAVVGQQPFGGGRQSGTNDKAGSHLNLLRWTSVRTIKETFIPIHNWEYPHMEQS